MFSNLRNVNVPTVLAAATTLAGISFLAGCTPPPPVQVLNERLRITSIRRWGDVYCLRVASWSPDELHIAPDINSQAGLDIARQLDALGANERRSGELAVPVYVDARYYSDVRGTYQNDYYWGEVTKILNP